VRWLVAVVLGTHGWKDFSKGENMVRTSVARLVFTAAGAALALSLVSVEASAAGLVRYRATGAACSEYADGMRFYGTPVGLTDYTGAGITCPIPTGSDLVELNDVNTRMFKEVTVWFQTNVLQNPILTTHASLYNTSPDGSAACVCDTDARAGTNGAFSMVLQQAGDGASDSPGCSASTCAGWNATWLISTMSGVVNGIPQNSSVGSTGYVNLSYFSVTDT
jgi:hypothetical protein